MSENCRRPFLSSDNLWACWRRVKLAHKDGLSAVFLFARWGVAKVSHGSVAKLASLKSILYGGHDDGGARGQQSVLVDRPWA